MCLVLFVKIMVYSLLYVYIPHFAIYAPICVISIYENRTITFRPSILEDFHIEIPLWTHYNGFYFGILSKIFLKPPIRIGKFVNTPLRGKYKITVLCYFIALDNWDIYRPKYFTNVVVHRAKHNIFSDLIFSEVLQNLLRIIAKKLWQNLSRSK